MEPGFYVVRMAARGAGSRLIVESICFKVVPAFDAGEETPREWARRHADNWRDFIAGQHPNDDVFVIEREGGEP